MSPSDLEPGIDPEGGWNPQDLWQDQQKELDPVTLADIRTKAVAFEKRISSRNAREFAACGLTIAAFLLIAVRLSPNWPMRAGALYISLATVFVAWQLHARFSVEATPQIGESLKDSYRRQMVRQRDGALSVWRWYLLPFAPGLILIEAGIWLRGPGPGVPVERFRAGFVISAAAMALSFLAVWIFNRRAARRLQKMIGDLD